MIMKKMKKVMRKMMKMTNDYPRGWYTYLYPDGEILVPLELEESFEEEIVLH